jgi:virginiamycin B lyase
LHTPANLIATYVVNVSPSSTSCTSNPDGTRDCTFSFGLPPPFVDLLVTTYDEAPVSGAISAGAKQLAAADVVNKSITLGKANSVSIALGGVVSSMKMTLPSPATGGVEQEQFIHGTVGSTSTVGLVAYDADGNIIMIDAFVNASGTATPVTVSLTMPNASCGSATIQTSGGTPGTTLTFATQPANGFEFQYGKSSFAGLIGATPCAFGLTASSGSIAVDAEFVLSGPKLYEYEVGEAPSSITAGPDGNIWFASTNTGYLYRFSLATDTETQWAALASSNAIAGGPPVSVSEPNTYIWSVGGASAQIASTAVQNSVASYTNGFFGPGEGIALASDGNEWFTDTGANSIGKVTPSGAITEYLIPTAASGVAGITVGPDGALWFAENTKNKIGRIPTDATSGSDIQEFPEPDGATEMAQGDGLVWFASESFFGSMTTLGTVAPFEKVSSNFTGIVQGPDQAMLLTDNGTGTLARFPFGSTSVGALVEYPLSMGANTSPFPVSITLGPDGNIWYADGSDYIGEMSL